MSTKEKLPYPHHDCEVECFLYMGQGFKGEDQLAVRKMIASVYDENDQLMPAGRLYSDKAYKAVRRVFSSLPVKVKLRIYANGRKELREITVISKK